MLPPRKAPHCRICQSPMKGHDRGSCSPHPPGSSPSPNRMLNGVDIMPGTLDGKRPSDRGWSPYPTPEPHSPPSESSSRWPEWEGFSVKSEAASINDLLSEIGEDIQFVDRILVDNSRSPTPTPVDYRDLTSLGYGRHGNGNSPLASVFHIPRTELQTLFVKAERLNLQCCLMDRPSDASSSKEDVWVVVGENAKVVEQIANFASSHSKLAEQPQQLVTAPLPMRKRTGVCCSLCSTFGTFTLLIIAGMFGAFFTIAILTNL